MGPPPGGDGGGASGSGGGGVVVVVGGGGGGASGEGSNLCVHARETAYQPSDIVSPFESREPCARKGLAWAGLWHDAFQIYESFVEGASARALRTERSSAKMAMESGSRSRFESRASSCERRGCATHSRGPDGDGTACFRSVYPAAAAVVRVEHGLFDVSFTTGR